MGVQQWKTVSRACIVAIVMLILPTLFLIQSHYIKDHIQSDTAVIKLLFQNSPEERLPQVPAHLQAKFKKLVPNPELCRNLKIQTRGINFMGPFTYQVNCGSIENVSLSMTFFEKKCIAITPGSEVEDDSSGGIRVPRKF